MKCMFMWLVLVLAVQPAYSGTLMLVSGDQVEFLEMISTDAISIDANGKKRGDCQDDHWPLFYEGAHRCIPLSMISSIEVTRVFQVHPYSADVELKIILENGKLVADRQNVRRIRLLLNDTLLSGTLEQEYPFLGGKNGPLQIQRIVF